MINLKPWKLYENGHKYTFSYYLHEVVFTISHKVEGIEQELDALFWFDSNCPRAVNMVGAESPGRIEASACHFLGTFPAVDNHPYIATHRVATYILFVV